MPKVSVIIPTYNRKNLVCEAIDSILAQVFQDFEIVVVDDGSTDGTRELIEQYPHKVKYIYQNNKGPAAARNNGVKHSDGEYIAFTDSDCIVDENWLNKLMKGFNDKKIAIVSGNTVTHNTENIIGQYSKLDDLYRLEDYLPHQFLEFSNTNNMILRKSFFEKVGGFDEDFPYAEDNEFCWRIQMECDSKIKFIVDAIVCHRPRDTFCGFFRQVFFWGMGRALLYARFKEFRQNIFQDTYFLARDVSYFLFRFLVRMAKFPFKRDRDMIFILEHPLRIMQRVVRYIGIQYGRIKYCHRF